VLAPWALPWIGAEGLVLAASVLAACAALVLAWDAGPRQRALPAASLAAALLALPFAGPLASVQAGPGKALGELLDHDAFPSTRVVSTSWSAIARVDVVDGAPPVVWTAPGASAPPPPELQILIDGDAATPILTLPVAPGQGEFLDAMLSTAALQALAPERVLVIGSGGGVDVVAALHHGADHVDAVEINPIIVDLVTGPHARRLDGLFSRPEVTLHHAEGRSFVRQSDDRYDLIQISLVDTWAAASSGAYSLAESYLYTTEAFDDYLEHLTDRGALTVTRWLTIPPRESMRLCTVAVEALRRRGVERAADHVAMLTVDRLVTLIVRREPFDAETVQAILSVAERRGYGVLYVPGTEASGGNPFADYLETPEPEAFIEAYPFDVTPVGDDSPFFFQFGRWSDANPLGEGWSDRPSDLSGRLVLLAVLVQAVVLSLLLLVLPLSRGQRTAPPSGTGRALSYFFLIGVGFMLLEVVLMQRFTLFLGNPLHAIAFVLAVLLASAGLGSFYGRTTARRAPGALFLVIALLCVAEALFLPHVFHLTLAAPLWLRFVVSAALLAPLGFLLGIPMPLAIERLAARSEGRLVGWAWAGNGAGSVLGPIVAALLAIDLGFTSVTLLAGATYAAAFISFGDWWHDSPSAPAPPTSRDAAPAPPASAPGVAASVPSSVPLEQPEELSGSLGDHGAGPEDRGGA